MNSSVLRRILRGVGANIGYQVSTILIQLVGVPILLQAWGAAKYGEWLVLFAIPSYLSITDLGFSQSAGNDMAQLIARREHDEARAVFHTVVAVVGVAMMVGLLVVTAIVVICPIPEWLGFSEIGDTSARWALWLFAVSVLVGLPDWTCHAAFRASGDYAFHTTVLASTRLTQHTGIWVTALVGGEPTAAAAVLLLAQILGTSISIRFLAKRHPDFRFGMSKRQRSIVKRLAVPSLANISFPLGQAMNIQGMVVLVGAILGPVAVVTFSTLRTLTRLLVQLVLAVSNAAEPELAAAYGLADKKLLRSIFVYSVSSAFWLAFSAAALLLVFGKLIVSVWTGDHISMDEVLFVWLLVAAVGTVLWWGALALLRAANAHMRAALVYCAITATVLVLAGVVTSATGRLTDVAVALVIVDAVMVTFLMRAAAALLGLPMLTLVAKIANPRTLAALVRSRQRTTSP